MNQNPNVPLMLERVSVNRESCPTCEARKNKKLASLTAQILTAMDDAFCDKLAVVFAAVAAVTKLGMLTKANEPVPIKSKCKWLPLRRLTRNPKVSEAA